MATNLKKQTLLNFLHPLSPPLIDFNLRQNLQPALTVVFLSTLGSSCGFQGSVSDQPSESIKLPNYPSRSDGFFLADGDDTKYNGGVLIWDENTTPEKIQEISRLSDLKKRTQADLLNYISKVLGPVNQSLYTLKQYVSRLKKESKAEQAARRARFTEMQLAQLRAESRTWFTKQIEPLAIEGLNKELATKKFRFYCDAKVWELAASQYLMSQKYYSRPTPSPFCEAFYDSDESGHKLLDRSTSECANSSAGKSYFNCLWNQGVLLTQFWQDRYGEASQRHLVSDLKSKITDGSWEDFVTDPSNAGSTITRNIISGKFYLPNGVLKPSRFNSTGIDPEMIVLVKRGFKLVLKVMDTLTKLPSKKDKWLFKANHDHDKEPENLTVIRTAIRSLGKRDKIRVIGASDIIYNNDISTMPLIAEDISDSSLNAEDRRKTGQIEFQNIFGTINKSLDLEAPEYVKLRAQKNIELENQSKKIAPLLERRGQFERNLTKTDNDTLDATSRETTLLALWSTVSLDIKKLSPEISKISIKMSLETRELSGCFTNSTGLSVDCPMDRNAIDSLSTEVTYDSDSYQLTIKLPLTEPAKSGFGDVISKETSPTAFNSLPGADIQDQDLSFKLFLNFADDLPLWTGEIRISRGVQPDYLGNVNLSGFRDAISALDARYHLE